jgi:hypothetical protein
MFVQIADEWPLLVATTVEQNLEGHDQEILLLRGPEDRPEWIYHPGHGEGFAVEEPFT